MSSLTDVPEQSLPESTTISSVTGKRKRSLENDNPLRDDRPLRGNDAQEETKILFDNLLLDTLEVLRRHDPTPSILECPITSSVDDRRDPKRVKLSSTNDPTSISSQITSRAYHNLNELRVDVGSAISIVSSPENGMAKPSSVAIFKNELQKIIARESLRNPKSLIRSVEAEDPVIKMEDNKTQKDVVLARSGQVTLSVFGAAANSHPKQVFASVRQDAINPTLAPLNEAGLPNGIAASALVPVHSMRTNDAKGKPRRFGEVFGPRQARPLDPPTQQSLHTITRGQQVNWYKPSDPFPAQPRLGGRESYYNQPSKTGYWLSYNTSPAASKLPSTGEKRKQRDRALSTGEPHAELDEDEQEEIRLIRETRQQAKDDALFKSVYSNFAPSHDNAGAVISHELKNRMWFNAYDHAKTQEYPDLPDWADPESRNDNTIERGNQDEVDEAELFREAVESFEETNDNPLDESILQNGLESTGDKSVDETLGEISDLIETLSSYQRSRNIPFPPDAQSTTPQKKALAELIGTPTRPSLAEFDMYDMLKNQLALIISMLPPYAVSKLNGDQLAKLNISSRIPIDEANHEGTLEEHESTKYAPPTANVNPASTPRPQMSALARPSSYQAQAATPANRTASYPAARPAQAPSHSHAGRPSLPAAQYGSYTQSTNSRVSYSQYGQQASSGQPNQYTNGTPQYPATNGYPTYSQYGATATSPNPPARPTPQQRPSQPGYQQRAQNAQSYSTYGQQAYRSASPQNPAAAYSVAQQRSSYAATTPVQRPGYYASSQTLPGNSSQAQPQARVQTPTHAGSSNRQGYAARQNTAAVNLNGTVGQAANLTSEDQAVVAMKQHLDQGRSKSVQQEEVATHPSAEQQQQRKQTSPQIPIVQTNGADGQQNGDGGPG